MRVIGFCLVLALLVLGPAQAAGGQSFFYGDGTKSVCLLTGTLDSPQALRGLMAWSSQALDLDQLRLLGRPHRDGLEFALVAQTSAPAEVILEVPTPMNSQLIAFLRAAEHEEMVDTFVYTVPMAPAQVKGFYQQALGNGGWWPLHHQRYYDGGTSLQVLSFFRPSQGIFILIDEGVDPVTYVQVLYYRHIAGTSEPVDTGVMSYAP